MRLQTQNFASGSAPPQRGLVGRRSGRRCRRQPQRHDRGGLGLDGQVGDDVLHQRLVGQQRAMCHDASTRARRIRPAEPSTQSSRVAVISMMVRTPRPAGGSATGAVELQLDEALGPSGGSSA